MSPGGSVALDARTPAVLSHDDAAPATDPAHRADEPARKRPRSGPSAVGEAADTVVLGGPAADAHLLADGVPANPRSHDLVTGLRDRAPPDA